MRTVLSCCCRNYKIYCSSAMKYKTVLYWTLWEWFFYHKNLGVVVEPKYCSAHILHFSLLFYTITKLANHVVAIAIHTSWIIGVVYKASRLSDMYNVCGHAKVDQYQIFGTFLIACLLDNPEKIFNQTSITLLCLSLN